MQPMIIYLIRNKHDGKGYIGQTIRSLEERWREHCLRQTNQIIDRAISKHGIRSFELSIIARTSNQDELNKLEKEYIQKCQTLSPDGYNLHTGGDRHQVSDETRARMSASKIGNRNSLGYKHSLETRAKLSRARLGNTNMRGKHLSETHKRKIALSLIGNARAKGKKHSAELRAKKSKALMGHFVSNEARLKMSAARTAAWKRGLYERDIQCGQ